jgi:endonuclease/exonuclease/phosphatase family metal-dependent hydrolase
VAQKISLKAMSFNIRYGTANDGENSWPLRKDAVLAFLATCDYDVIGLQEALFHQLQEIREAAPFFHYIGVGRDDGIAEGEYSAILYDSRRIEIFTSETFWLSSTPGVVATTSWGNKLTRICTHGCFELEGQRFDVFNTHLDHESALSRVNSSEMIAERVRRREIAGPVIVTGDFNEPEAGPAVLRMAEGGLIDTYRTIHPDGPEPETCHNWTPNIIGDKIDYVFVTPEVQVVDATIVRDTPFRKYLSDHHPVVATLLI